MMFDDGLRRTDVFKYGQGILPPAGILSRVRKLYIGKLIDTEIWGVDGEVIRDEIGDDEFEGGGNFARYLYIPAGQIWIESCLPMQAWPPLLIHEYVEMHNMIKTGIPYEQAHNLARFYERQFRVEDKTLFQARNEQEILSLVVNYLKRYIGY